MNKLLLKCAGSILILFLLIIVQSAHSQSPSIGTETIEVDLAWFVAEQQVYRYYPEFEWHALDHMTIHDIDGAVKAYAFVFAEAGSDILTAAELREHIQEKSAVLDQAKEQANAEHDSDSAEQARARIIEAEEALYSFQNLATIITGATSDSKLILRHFRGIPEFWVNAEAPNEASDLEQIGKSQRISHIVMITPMDFRIVFTESGGAQPLSTDMRSSQGTTFSDTAQVFGARAGKVRSIVEMREGRQAIEARKQQRLNALEPPKRARYEKALQDRAKAMADKWQQYRGLWQKARDEGEAAR